MIRVTAIFDIGKTNKKFILFDKNFKEVFRVYKKFKEIPDEDGFPSDDINAIIKWMKKVFSKALKNKKFQIHALNFSTYGASLVYIDKNGNQLTPLYNYTKPYPKKVHNKFFKKHGKEKTIAKETASPSSGMLNAGMQLFWLKQTKPDVFKQIKHALHLPQYLSYVFTGIAVSEYTSIGCHTSLWDFKKEIYHRWVIEEKLDMILPPIVPTTTSVNVNLSGQQIKVGIGIHDSSAALLPYFLCNKNPFLLISTGTWSISLNPFNKATLTKEELSSDGLNYMRIDGHPVKSARLFLGKEYEIQVKRLTRHFKKPKDFHQNIKYSAKLTQRLIKKFQRKFDFEVIPLKRKKGNKNKSFDFVSFKEAYHQLMLELIELQIESIKRAKGKTKIQRIYIDGGFADNKVFLTLLLRSFPNIEISSTKSPIGSAIGAAMVISSKKIKPDFLKKHAGLINHRL